MLIQPIDMSRAAVCHGPNGSVTIADPGSPLTVTVTTRPHPCGGPRRITSIAVELPDCHPGRITTRVLSRLPLQRITALTAPSRHPDDRHWTALADQRHTGARSWPPDHWAAVADVYRWARDSGRPGGGRQAIADLWQVTPRPTVSRWLARCRHLGLLEPAERRGRQLGVVPLGR